MINSIDSCINFIKNNYNNLFKVIIPNINIVILYNGNYTNFEINQYPYKAHCTLFKDGSIRLNSFIKLNVLIGSLPIVNYIQGRSRGTGIIYWNKKWQETNFSSPNDIILKFN